MRIRHTVTFDLEIDDDLIENVFGTSDHDEIISEVEDGTIDNLEELMNRASEQNPASIQVKAEILGDDYV